MIKFTEYSEKALIGCTPIHRSLSLITLLYEEKATALFEAFEVIELDKPDVSVVDKLRSIHERAPEWFCQVVASIAAVNVNSPWIHATSTTEIRTDNESRTMHAFSMYDFYYSLCVDPKGLPSTAQLVGRLLSVIPCSEATALAAEAFARKYGDFEDDANSESFSSDDVMYMRKAYAFIRSLRPQKRWRTVGNRLKKSLTVICANTYTRGIIAIPEQ